MAPCIVKWHIVLCTLISVTALRLAAVTCQPAEYVARIPPIVQWSSTLSSRSKEQHLCYHEIWYLILVWIRALRRDYFSTRLPQAEGILKGLGTWELEFKGNLSCFTVSSNSKVTRFGVFYTQCVVIIWRSKMNILLLALLLSTHVYTNSVLN